MGEWDGVTTTLPSRQDVPSAGGMLMLKAHAGFDGVRGFISQLLGRETVGELLSSLVPHNIEVNYCT